MQTLEHLYDLTGLKTTIKESRNHYAICEVAINPAIAGSHLSPATTGNYC